MIDQKMYNTKENLADFISTTINTLLQTFWLWIKLSSCLTSLLSEAIIAHYTYILHVLFCTK